MEILSGFHALFVIGYEFSHEVELGLTDNERPDFVRNEIGIPLVEGNVPDFCHFN